MSPPQDADEKRINAELVPDAGKVTIDAGKPWGKGLMEDIRTTVGTHWVSEMVSFRLEARSVVGFKDF